MAAGQQKKRLHASSVVSNDLHEHCSAKKKKTLVSPHNFLNINAHISLEWDEYQQKVVAKREQIGIQWRKLGPFINPLPPAHSALADVIPIPQEVFGLEDLTGVLSYEVWETVLSGAEKSFLTQFLPKGVDAEQVVRSLLTGANLHFGNPFLKWSDSLCSGKLHPDAILCQEKRFDAYKNTYDSEIQKYHNEYLNDDLVGYMQKLKETWMCREGPERDIVEKMLRNGYADKHRDISTPSERLKVVSSSRKEVKPQRLFVRSGDGAKYMSYFKITRKQHQLVKGIKQPDGIKSNSLNHILGDIYDFHVQPYEVYEEEERNRLHEHWLQVANIDIPSAFTNWRERLIQKQHWSKSLEEELKNNQISGSEDEEGSTQEERFAGEANAYVTNTRDDDDNDNDTHDDDDDDGGGDDDDDDDDGDGDGDGDGDDSPHSATSGPVELIHSDNSHHEEFEVMNCASEESIPEKHMEHLQQLPSLNGALELGSLSTESEQGSEELYEQEGSTPVLSKFVGPTKVSEQRDLLHFVGPTKVSEQRDLLHFVGPTGSQPLQRIPSLNGPQELDRLDIGLPDNIPKLMTSNGTMARLVGDINPSPKEAWLDPYYNHTPINHGYPSSDEISIGHPQFLRQHQPGPGPTHVIGLDAKESLLHKSTEDMRSSFAPSFPNSYANQEHNELFDPFMDRQRLVVPTHLGAHNVLLEAGHPPGHLQEQQQQLLKHRQQMREREFYMQQAAHNKNVYTTNNGMYPPQVNVQNWAPVDPVSTHSRGGWSGMEPSNGSNADGSLYSVLSQFNNTSSTGTPQGIIGSTSDGFAQTNYLRGPQDQNSGMQNNTSWMNLQPQTSGLHDSVGKPFLRSWNL